MNKTYYHYYDDLRKESVDSVLKGNILITKRYKNTSHVNYIKSINSNSNGSSVVTNVYFN